MVLGVIVVFDELNKCKNVVVGVINWLFRVVVEKIDVIIGGYVMFGVLVIVNVYDLFNNYLIGVMY